VTDLIDRIVHEGYAAHAIITNLGFEPEEVQACLRHIVNADPPGLHACMLVEREGRQFVFHIHAVTEEEGAAFQEAWLAFAEAKPRMSRAELDAILYGSQVWRMREDLLWALVAKGFTPEPGRMVH